METKGAFHSTKIPVLNFGNFTCPMEWYGTFRLHRPDPSHRASGYCSYKHGTTILSNGKGPFGKTDRKDQTGQRGPPSKLVPNIPVGPNRNGRNFGLNGKRPKMIRILINSSKSLLSKLFLVWSFFMTNSFGVLKTYTRWKWGLVPSCF